MDNEGYPEVFELEKIEQWDYKDFVNLIDFIEERWTYAESGYFSKEWTKDDIHGMDELTVNMSTAGWSGNESIIESLLKNRLFCMCWYYSWRRGGHYVFKINPYNAGFKRVSEVAKEKGVSRQMIHKAKDNYDWIFAGKRTRLCRSKVQP